MQDSNNDNTMMGTNCGVGYAFVPTQVFEAENVYAPADALENGTLFPELNMPMGVYEKGVVNCG